MHPKVQTVTNIHRMGLDGLTLQPFCPGLHQEHHNLSRSSVDIPQIVHFMMNNPLTILIDEDSPVCIKLCLKLSNMLNVHDRDKRAIDIALT